jgi:hypothetical protein
MGRAGGGRSGVFAALAWLVVSSLFSWYLGNFANYNATYGSTVGGEYQQRGGRGDQEIAGGSEPKRRVNAEGNAGDNSNARSENDGSTVDAPKPRRGA